MRFSMLALCAWGSLATACALDWNMVTGSTEEAGQPFPDGGHEDSFDANMESGTRSDTNGLRSCSRDVPCYFDEYCDYPDRACGTSDAKEGVCRRRPETCTQADSPQCGCDGLLYTHACEAHRAGMDNGSDACAPDGPKHFACGNTSCVAGREYCLMTGFLTNRQFQCKPFVDCDAANCSCKPDPCVGACYEVPGGGTTHDCSL